MEKENLIKEIIEHNKKEFPWLFSSPLFKIEYIKKWVEIEFFDKLNEDENNYENDIEQCCAMIVSSYKVEVKYGK